MIDVGNNYHEKEKLKLKGTVKINLLNYVNTNQILWIVSIIMSLKTAKYYSLEIYGLIDVNYIVSVFMVWTIGYLVRFILSIPDVFKDNITIEDFLDIIFFGITRKPYGRIFIIIDGLIIVVFNDHIWHYLALLITNIGESI